jgi:hypothetical protein
MEAPYLRHCIPSVRADNHYICMADCIVANTCDLIQVRYD